MNKHTWNVPKKIHRSAHGNLAIIFFLLQNQYLDNSRAQMPGGWPHKLL